MKILVVLILGFFLSCKTTMPGSDSRILTDATKSKISEFCRSSPTEGNSSSSAAAELEL